MRTSDEPQREGIRRGLDPLHERYRRFALHALEVTDPEGARAEDVDLVFGLVESIVSQRYWGEQEDREAYGRSIARGCLRLSESASRTSRRPRSAPRTSSHGIALAADATCSDRAEDGGTQCGRSAAHGRLVGAFPPTPRVSSNSSWCGQAVGRAPGHRRNRRGRPR